MLTWMLLVASALAEDCPAPVPAALFEIKMQEVEQSLQSRDLQQLGQRLGELETYLPCLVQPINTAQASRYHLLQGVNLWIGRNTAMAQLHFSAAKAANDTAKIPATVFPEGHGIHETFGNAPPLLEAKQVEGAPSEQLRFDGAPGGLRPLYRPTIFQYVVGDVVDKTVLLQPGTTVPLPEKAPDDTPAAPEEEATSEKKTEEKPDSPSVVAEPDDVGVAANSLRRPLLYATAGAAGVGMGFFGLYASNQLALIKATEALADGDDPNIDVAGTKSKRDIGFAGAAISAAATVGLGVTLVLKW
jgi:hypothetical protein